jgi:type IV pilus assembly protein PilB
MGANRLGDGLVKTGKINKEQLQQGLAHQKEKGGRLGSALVKLAILSEKELVEFLSQHFSVPAIDLQRVEVDESVIKLIPADVARKYTILPVAKVGAKITLAMIDPTNVFAMDDVKFMTGYNVEPVVASETALRIAIDKYYGSTHALELKKVMEDLNEPGGGDPLTVLDEESELDIEALEKESEEAPVVRLVNIVLTDAIKRGASDIHIEPYEKEFRVRYRIDGVLYEMMHPPLRLRDAITSRLKILAKLDIAEKRIPQDGAIALKSGEKRVDLRVSTVPTVFGEKMVIRILAKGGIPDKLQALGFTDKQSEDFLRAAHSPKQRLPVMIMAQRSSPSMASIYPPPCWKARGRIFGNWR